MRKIIQTIFSVGALAFFTYLFTFFMDGSMGIILIVFFVTAPLISFALAVSSRKRIKVSLRCDSYVNKNNTIKVTVKVEKTGKLPLSVIEIVPEVSEVFDKMEKTFRLSMFTDESTEFSFDVRGRVGGNGSISIKKVYSCGFLGFMRLKAKGVLPEPVSVGVVPEIPDIKSSSQLFMSIADVVFTSDDEEESDTSMLFSANTSPGYEHREYVEGDPLKRVNWKLSSKKNKLMVRLDEAASSVQPLIVLDLYRKTGASAEYAVITEEKIIRSVFGLVTLLVKQGIACDFAYYGTGGDMVVETVDNPEYPAQLLLKVLAVKVTEGRRIDLRGMRNDVCACLIATTDAGSELAAVTDVIEDRENTSILGVSAESVNATGLKFWYLDEDENFKMV